MVVEILNEQKRSKEVYCIMNKETIAVLFGGQSNEHEVSCVSVQTVIKNMDAEKYNILMIGITKEGAWLLAKSLEDIASGAWRQSKTRAVISPDASVKGVLLCSLLNHFARLHINLSLIASCNSKASLMGKPTQ